MAWHMEGFRRRTGRRDLFATIGHDIKTRAMGFMGMDCNYVELGTIATVSISSLCQPLRLPSYRDCLGMFVTMGTYYCMPLRYEVSLSCLGLALFS
jgi:hypothetical protein